MIRDLRRRARVVVLAGLAALTVSCAVPVAATLDEAEANRVIVALDQSGIDAAKEIDPAAEGKYRVMVARDDASRALATMREEELPRAQTRGVLETADRGQLVPSQAAEHAQIARGLAGELEKTLGGIDNVLAARVHLNLPQHEALRDGPTPKATASVLIEHRGTTPPIAPESVQRLVAGGAPGVAPAEVVVVFVPRTARASMSRTDLAHVGPITVLRGSMNTLKLAFASAALLVVTLAATTLALWAKVSRLRREREVELAAAAARTVTAPRSVHPALSGSLAPPRPSGGLGA